MLARTRDPRTYSGVELGSASMILHSQANLDQFPDNVMSAFHTKLTKPLPLYGHWMMSMHSMQYNNNIINLEQLEGPTPEPVEIRVHLVAVLHAVDDTTISIDIPVLLPAVPVTEEAMSRALNASLATVPVPRENSFGCLLRVNVFEGNKGWIRSNERLRYTIRDTDLLAGAQQGRSPLEELMHIFNTAVDRRGRYGNVKRMELVNNKLRITVFGHRVRMQFAGSGGGQGKLKALVGFEGEKDQFDAWASNDEDSNQTSFHKDVHPSALDPLSMHTLLQSRPTGSQQLGLSWYPESEDHGYTHLELSVNRVEGPALHNPFKHIVSVHMGRGIGQQPTIDLPTLLNKELSRVQELSLSTQSNAVLLQFGWRSATNTVQLVYSRTAHLSVPGSYRPFDILSSELLALFTNLPYHGDEELNLSDILDIRKVTGINKVRFRLKTRARVTAGQLTLNYVEMSFSPHLAQLIGLLSPDISPSDLKASNIQVMSQRIITTNEVTADLTGLGSGNGRDPVSLTITADDIGNSILAPYSENCDLGITEMYVYLPQVIEKMSVGKTTSPLLATVPIVTSASGETRTHHTVINPRQRRLLHETVSEVDVEVKDVQGRRIKFASSINAVTIQISLQTVKNL